MRKTLLWASVMALFLAIGFVGWWSMQGEHVQKPEHLYVLDQPKAVPDFTLRGTQNKPFNQASLKGHWHMLYFGFTHCPDICPAALSAMQKVTHQWDDEHTTGYPDFVFVSVDPDRDSVKQLGAYVHHFNAHFTGAVGSPAAIQSLQQAFTIFSKAQGKTIVHSDAVLFINPKGEYVGLLLPPYHFDSVNGAWRYLTKHAQPTGA